MSTLANWRQRWGQVSRREQRLIALALGVVTLALLWWLALAPALKVLQTAPQQHQALDAQLQQMQHLQAQAHSLRAQPMPATDEAIRALQASLKPLAASAQLVLQQERATVTLKAVSPEALAQWLATARQNARTVPTQARLVRNAAGAWDGTVVLQLAAP